MAIILGIDPGLNGAIAALDAGTGELKLYETPTVTVKKGKTNKREIVPGVVAAIIGGQIVDHAYYEHVWARQGEAASNSFTFGDCYGVIRGALAMGGVRSTPVAPVTWQKAMGVRGHQGDLKDACRARAIELFPDYAGDFKLKADSGKADAALIALYGARQLGHKL